MIILVIIIQGHKKKKKYSHIQWKVKQNDQEYYWEWCHNLCTYKLLNFWMMTFTAITALSLRAKRHLFLYNVMFLNVWQDSNVFWVIFWIQKSCRYLNTHTHTHKVFRQRTDNIYITLTFPSPSRDEYYKLLLNYICSAFLP